MVDVVARIFQGIEFLRWGVVTNWWGLGCPAHCGSTSFASWALAFIAVDFALVLSWAIISLDFT